MNIGQAIREIQKAKEAALAKLDLRRDVLDKGYIQLIDFMGDDDAPVDAARASFDGQAINYTHEQNDKLMAYLIKHEHTSPSEMMVAKFRVHAPVLVWWHWVRHRMASYNFVSGRYVPFTEDQFYEIAEDQWRLQSKTNKQGSDGLLDRRTGRVFTLWLKEHTANGYKHYENALNAGIAREQARVFLPFAGAYYTAIVQMNASSLLHFLRLRRGGDAQSEIRDYADALYGILHETHKRIFA